MINTNIPFAPASQKKSQDARGTDSLLPIGDKGASPGKFDEHLQALDRPQKAPAKILRADSPPARDLPRPVEERLTPKSKAVSEKPSPDSRPGAKRSGRLEAAPAETKAEEKTNPDAEDAQPNERRTPASGKRLTKAVATPPPEGRGATPLPKEGGEMPASVGQELESETPGNVFPETMDVDWRRRLEEMMALAGIQGSSFLQTMPSLALLTGQLEYIEPEAIPGVISETPVIQEFLSAESPEAVIEQVKPLGAWLQDMGWTPSGLMVDDPVALQRLLATPISLRDLMNGFNVDVNRVLKEAQILQEALPLDGFKPYVERAVRLQGPGGPKVPPQPTPNPLTRAFEPKKGPEIVEKDESDAAWATAALMAQGMILADAGDGSMRAIDLPQTLTADGLQRLTSAALEGKTPESTPRVPLEGSPELWIPSAAAPLDPRTASFLSFMPATQDPFQSLMPFAPTQTHSFVDVRAGAQADVQMVPSMDLLQQLQASQIQSQGLAPAPDALPHAADRTFDFMPQGSLQVDALLSERGADTGQNQEQGFGDSSRENAAPLPGQTQSSGKAEFKAEEAVAKSDRAAPVMKQIVDHTSVMIKDGGGSMRLDLGNKDIGELNLAVEVKDGNVEIKILTPSPEARELLGNELPRLREALQNQNLDLKKVEITLGGGSAWTQTSSDGRQQSRRDEYQTFEEKSIRGVNGNGRMSKSYSQMSQVQTQGPSVFHNGAIQVRV